MWIDGEFSDLGHCGNENQICERLSNRDNGLAFTGMRDSLLAEVNAAMNLKQLAVGQTESRRKSNGFCEANGNSQKPLPSATFCNRRTFPQRLAFPLSACGICVKPYQSGSRRRNKNTTTKEVVPSII